MNGAEVLLEALEQEAVEDIFGYPGAVLLALLDALLKSKIRHILVRHEQGAVHAADGYARVNSKVGVCLATSGPGATNLVTGIANAYMDSIPMVILTGQVSTELLGTDSFQEADITGITIPITKHSYLVKDAAEIPRIVKEAFYLARTGRPGPVLIDLPKDILSQEVKKPASAKMSLKSYKVFGKGNTGQIEEFAKSIAQSAKPVIYAGGGIITAGATGSLRDLVEKCNLPVVSTLMGLGCLPSDHPNFLGMAGMHGTVTANYALADCDLLIALGVRFDDRITSGLGHMFAAKAKIVHIDIDPAEIGKVVRANVPIVGDAHLILEELVTRLVPPEISEWWEQIRGWQNCFPLRYEQDGRLSPQIVLESIAETAGDDAIIVTDVGQHQMWVAQSYPFKYPRQLVTSGGLGTMGFGLPAAVGAQVAQPEKKVVLITGDGSLQMTIQELATIVQHQLPVKIVLMNNGVLGLVRQWQKMLYDERFSEIQLHANPDFVKVAEAYGIKGIRVTSAQEVKPCLTEAMAYPGPVLMDYVISPDEVVLPMVVPGNAITDMLGR
ncbi:MAG TPA: biosynthetic-type acetolactate synthase large subunit [Desulfitobacteriaceae bacterium]|jgi:acetolactate synthase-1/2/3 large subunit|nr:biosynthetic-type acetolactate synthase large subunit [Desulfitobacteriaceae bacterium]